MDVFATRKYPLGGSILLCLVFAGFLCEAQTMPATGGESLSGHRVVLAQAIRSHVSIVIAGFTRESGSGAERWSKAIRADASLASATVFQAVMLGRAPGFVRGLIVAGMRKDTPADMQDTFVVMTQDEPLWRSYFGVTNDKDPYVVLIDADGQVRWHGHGDAANLEPLLKAALK